MPSSRQQRHYQKLKAAGLCVRCATTTGPAEHQALAVPDRTQCQQCLEVVRNKALAWQAQLRADMRTAYGESCAECGETRDLHFHHLNGDGDQHREKLSGDAQGGGWKTWQDLRARGFPPVIQVLCRDCHEIFHHSRTLISTRMG